MNNFKDILKNSVNGSYCVYILLIADIPANLISLGVSYFNRITANIITLSSFSLNLLSASFAINGDFFISSILFYAGFLLDFVDGKIARLRNEASSFGKKLDMFVDRFGFMLISLAYLYYFLSNGIYFEAWILILYSFIFFLYDIFQLTDNLSKDSSYSDNKRRIADYSPDKYLDIIKSFKRWFPSRLLTIFLMFSIAPITNFSVVYSFCLFVLLIRFSRIMIIYFKHER